MSTLYERTFRLGDSHNFIWGLGVRFLDSSIEQISRAVLIRNPEFDQRLCSAFLQDEFQLIPRKLTLTAGLKLEHNSYTDFELQPSVRVA